MWSRSRFFVSVLCGIGLGLSLGCGDLTTERVQERFNTSGRGVESDVDPNAGRGATDSTKRDCLRSVSDKVGGGKDVDVRGGPGIEPIPPCNPPQTATPPPLPPGGLGNEPIPPCQPGAGCAVPVQPVAPPIAPVGKQPCPICKKKIGKFWGIWGGFGKNPGP